MKGLLLSLLLISLPACAKTTDAQCLKYAVWKEARGESLKTQRAVIDVIVARVRKTGKGVCKVLNMRGQFPWRIFGIKQVDSGYHKVYNVVVMMKPVFKADSGYLFFNHRKHPWGRNTVKIGNLYFSQ